MNWSTSTRDKTLIDRIVDRSCVLFDGIDRMSLEMDLVATHNHNGGLRLEDLLQADDFNFAHDISGILRHMDRKTGRLGGFFVPRFAQHAAVPA